MLELQPKFCDECGRLVQKIHRVFRSHGYCSTCYARVFKERQCSGCGEIRRLPKDNLSAICSKCETSKPCIRCHRSDVETGLITQYGRVCKTCSVFFRPQSPCEACGQPSSQLSRVSRLGGVLRLCPRCQRSDFRTCSACRHFRLVSYISPTGHPLCKSCHHLGEIPCKICGKLMPAGRVSCCIDCYWARTARNRLAIDREAFTSFYMAREFDRFGNWLLATYGSKAAALSIHRYITFFLEVEKTWGSFPGYRSLVDHFKAEGLRRIRRPMRWLSETHKIRPNPAVREETSERARLENILARHPKQTITGQALHSYMAKLQARLSEGKTTIRSIRLALTPAEGLSRIVVQAGLGLPSQNLLDAYLRDRPGQKAAITGFINFLNSEYKINLTARVDPKLTRQNRRKKLEQALATMMQNELKGAQFLEQWAPVALEYFHNVKIPKRLLRSLLESAECVDDLGVNVIVNGQACYIPVPIKGHPTNHEFFQKSCL